ncbi:MAG: ABC-F family ATP-binding cassette domain-containing protein [Lachnospiraceae bacterium]
MILSCQNIVKTFGTDLILDGANFFMEENEKVAIVGINGAGKSTLLKIIMNEWKPDSGEVILAKGKTLGYQSQLQSIADSHTIYEEVREAKADLIVMEEKIAQMETGMSTCPVDQMEAYMNEYHVLCDEFQRRDGYAYKSEINGVIKGLGFSQDEFNKKMNELSGGQKTRVALAKLLVAKPDLILLDEPTNHLDIASITWLEGFLKNYNGGVIIVSHDRYFLDRIVNKVVEIENHKTIVYQGTYTEFSRKKELVRNAQLKHYFEQQAEIKHHEEVITKLKSFNREASIKRAESREKLVDKIERIEKPLEVRADMRFSLEPDVTSGNDVLKVEGLAKTYEQRQLFQDLDFEIKRGERVAIIGANGTGKTTILKIINDFVTPDKGCVYLGTNVHIGYYDQEQQILYGEKELFQELQDDYPTLTNTKIRNVLGAFLFTNDDVFKKIKDLSGGERGRMALAKLMLSDSNFLILDEPTNHLDINSKEILETALNNYTGTVLFVSHDRYFINQVASRVIELEDGVTTNYIGNYDYYLEKKEEAANAVRIEREQNKSHSPETNVTDWKKQKEESAALRKKENAIKKIEEEIADTEEKKNKLEEQLANPEIASNSGKLNELTAELNKEDRKLDELYQQWETLFDR